LFRRGFSDGGTLRYGIARSCDTSSVSKLPFDSRAGEFQNAARPCESGIPNSLSEIPGILRHPARMKVQPLQLGHDQVKCRNPKEDEACQLDNDHLHRVDLAKERFFRRKMWHEYSSLDIQLFDGHAKALHCDTSRLGELANRTFQRIKYFKALVEPL
jgi:hypothetical protein